MTTMTHIFTIAFVSALTFGISRAENTPPAKVVFDFTDAAAIGGWAVEDDVIMGGRSKSTLVRDPAGHIVFSGDVSLENNGGFASIQNHFAPIDVSKYTHVVIRLKGDGKKFRYLVEAEKNARHYYVSEFSTNGEWQEIKIPLREMYPVRRGDRLDIPNFPGKTMTQSRFMIANGRAEAFRLEVASIRLE